MNLDRSFGHHHNEIDIAGDAFNFKRATPPAQKPCIDDARRWLGCNPTRQANCAFFDGKNKLPGCALYPTNGAPHKTIWRASKIAPNKPPIAPSELDGYHIEEAS